MNYRIKSLAFSLAALAFLCSPGSGSLRQIASCDGLGDVQPPPVPFGTNFFEQLDQAAFKQSQENFSQYLGKATSDFLSMRQSIRNGYGLDMPSGYQNPFTTPTSLIPSNPAGGGILAANSAAFQAFMPLASYGTTNAFQMPTGVFFPSTGPSFGGAFSAPSLNMAFGPTPSMSVYPQAAPAPANVVSFQR